MLLGPVAMPDLDHASEVVMSGSSAGGAGVRMNIDWLAELFAPNGTTVRGLLDATTQVDDSNPVLLWDQTSSCLSRGVCSYDDLLDDMYEVQADFRDGFMDQSCLTTALDVRRCADLHYVGKNHVTTPFFVREDQLDSLHYDLFLGTGYQYDGPLLPSGSPPLMMNVDNTAVRLTYGELVKTDMQAFESILTTAVEAGSMTVAPGVFNPHLCVHEALASDLDAFRPVPDGNGNQYGMEYYWNNWVNHSTVDPITFYAPIEAMCP